MEQTIEIHGTIQVDPARPEKHREVLIVPFQDHKTADNILHNGFGIEIIGADYALFRADGYKAWLRSSSEVVVQFPIARSSFLGAYESYERERNRIGESSTTYEQARQVVRNRVLAQADRKYYNLAVRFPSDFNLTNAVFTPDTAPFGRITPQITPVLTSCKVNQTRTLVGIEVDLAFRVTVIETEPRRVTSAIMGNANEDALNDALNDMVFPDPDQVDDDESLADAAPLAAMVPFVSVARAAESMDEHRDSKRTCHAVEEEEKESARAAAAQRRTNPFDFFRLGVVSSERSEPNNERSSDRNMLLQGDTDVWEGEDLSIDLSVDSRNSK